jgi:hypothetical protein
MERGPKNASLLIMMWPVRLMIRKPVKAGTDLEKPLKSGLTDEAIEAIVFIPEMGDRGKWFRFTAAAIRDSRSEMFGAIGTTEDVTEEKLADEELIRIKNTNPLARLLVVSHRILTVSCPPFSETSSSQDSRPPTKTK